MSHVLRHNVADQIAYFRAFNTDGSAKTDVTSATAGLTLSVFRVGASNVSISSLSNKAADNTTHSDGAIRNVGGNLYTIDLPDAATATQVPSIVVRGSYTGGVIEGLEHPVVAYNPAVAYATETLFPANFNQLNIPLDGGIRVSGDVFGSALATATNLSDAVLAILAAIGGIEGGGGPSARTISITVESGTEAVAGVRIQALTALGVPTSQQATTGTLGTATLYLDDGSYLLRVTPPNGFETPSDAALTVDGNETVTIELSELSSSGSVLKVSYDELRREVGRHLGFDRDPDNWDANQTQDVADIVKQGQWHFYWPPVTDQTATQSHLWSFLCVSHQINLTADTYAYELPDDFVRMQSGFTFGSNGNEFRLAVIDDEKLRSMQSRNYLKGIPRYVAIRARNNRLDEGYELAFYPTPDASFTIEFRYEKLPGEINSTNQYHLGPAVHSKLLVSACLMEADRKLNPESMGPDGGVHAQQFFRQLGASIAVDRQAVGTPSQVVG